MDAKGTFSISTVAGANCYTLLTRSADEGLRHEVLAVLDGAAAMHMTVLRCWAFNDGPDEWNALQTAPGVYDERVFRGLDWLLQQAAFRRLQVVLTLTNYWPDFGGLQQYVRWSRGVTKSQGGNVTSEPFYTDAMCQSMYRRFVTDVLTRRNTLTGVLYREDSTIHSWDLCNEPRCQGDTSCNILDEWVTQTAAFVRSLDSYHPITVGSEGFFGPSTPHLQQHNPYDCTDTGVDFVRHSRIAGLDYVCCHVWVDQWAPQLPGPARVTWVSTWLQHHVSACERELGGRALVLQEFGKAPADDDRTRMYRQVYDLAEASRARDGVLRGTMLWMLAPPSYPNYDGYTIYVPGSRACADCEAQRDRDEETRRVILQHCCALSGEQPAPSYSHPPVANNTGEKLSVKKTASKLVQKLFKQKGQS